MFGKQITQTPLTTDIADGCFENITVESYKNDVTFRATMRALLYKRIQKHESVSVKFYDRSLSSGRLTDFYLTEQRKLILDNRFNDDISYQIVVCNYTGNEEGKNTYLSYLDKIFSDQMFLGFEPIQSLCKFFEQKKITARFYRNPNDNRVFILVYHLDFKKLHLLQSFITVYFPELFEKFPLQDIEMELLKSLTNRYAVKYESVLQEISEQFNLREFHIKKCLNEFETRFERNELAIVRNEIIDCRHEMNMANQTYSRLYQMLIEKIVYETGLLDRIRQHDNENNEGGELTEFFIANKGLDIIHVDENEIQFFVKTYISSFDPEVFDRAISNRNSFFYRRYDNHLEYGNDELTDDRIEKLMRAIFEDEKLKLRVCAFISMRVNRGTVDSITGYHYPDHILKDHIPNQHLNVYNCFGNNLPDIRRAMADGDYVRAVALCMASVSNINFTESNTGTYFMEKICSKCVGKIITMPDGTTMTPVEAVKWLEAQEEKEEKQNEQTD